MPLKSSNKSGKIKDLSGIWGLKWWGLKWHPTVTDRLHLELLKRITSSRTWKTSTTFVAPSLKINTPEKSTTFVAFDHVCGRPRLWHPPVHHLVQLVSRKLQYQKSWLIAQNVRNSSKLRKKQLLVVAVPDQWSTSGRFSVILIFHT